MASYTKLNDLVTKERASSEHQDGDEERLLESDGVPSRQSRRSCLTHHRRTTLIHLVFLCANVFVLTAYASRWMSRRDLHDPHSLTPFKEVISYEQRQFEVLAIYLSNGTLNPHKSNAFGGPPRKELEDEWNHLMKHESIRVQRSGLGQFEGDDSIVELADGTGHYSTVAVFHGLHSVQRLHHYLYLDHYYPHLSEKELFLLKRHTEHCLDWLRQYVQCNADTTLIPIRWSADSPGPVAQDSGKHQCVVWEDVYDRMAERSFDPFQPGLLVHPIFGNPYTHKNSTGHGKNLGATQLGRQEACHSGSSERFHLHARHQLSFSTSSNHFEETFWNMTSSSQPFLSAEDRLESNMSASDNQTRLSRSHTKRTITRRFYTATQVVICLLAIWGFATICLAAARHVLTQPARAVRPDPYHPETLALNLNICDCGSTIAEALSRDCIYDTMATAWLPPYCRDEELTAEFDRAGPGPEGAWMYFADANGTTPLNKTQLGELGETGGTFWVSRKWHIAHCVFYWQKYWRIRRTGRVMEKRFDTLAHVQHCSRLILNPMPDHDFLLQVPVTMNSSKEIAA
ncbi:hypothetical protein HIM_08921 [Hirsutella minnesotensis 3608]|uniref:Uncharacterized protein n=1 Tax=Hirsutella minnesotensis 3608 TaxID=1043627 RepID=A0A0F7ZSN7_9HYPO|nr:hypothetical protein HIM_08921 [Hirsutella minnesotensis 3608]